MTIRVGFGDEKLKKTFDELSRSDPELHRRLERAIEDLEINPFSGIQIPKRLWPKIYIKKYDIKTLWKYNLPDAWRLIYTVRGNQVELLTIILEWMNHKNYERRFG